MNLCNGPITKTQQSSRSWPVKRYFIMVHCTSSSVNDQYPKQGSSSLQMSFGLVVDWHYSATLSMELRDLTQPTERYRYRVTGVEDQAAMPRKPTVPGLFYSSPPFSSLFSTGPNRAISSSVNALADFRQSSDHLTPRFRPKDFTAVTFANSGCIGSR
jgi:hypothetical protein